MLRSLSVTPSVWPLRIVLGFVAAFLATLTFHQFGLLVLHLVGVTPAMPWAARPVPPFGVPQVISLAFWGGIWGIVFVLVEPYLARSPGGYVAGAILFGAIFPTLVAWFVVLPLKGLPAGNGFHFPGIIVGPIVNGLWGLGTAAFLHILTGWRSAPAPSGGLPRA
jgi:hypothetical protein